MARVVADSGDNVIIKERGTEVVDSDVPVRSYNPVGIIFAILFVIVLLYLLSMIF